MKWNEMSTGKKIAAVIGIACGVAWVVSFILELCNIQAVPDFILYAVLGLLFLCTGLIQTSKPSKILNCISAAIWLLHSIYDAFVLLLKYYG